MVRELSASSNAKLQGWESGEAPSQASVCCHLLIKAQHPHRHPSAEDLRWNSHLLFFEGMIAEGFSCERFGVRHYSQWCTEGGIAMRMAWSARYQAISTLFFNSDTALRSNDSSDDVVRNIISMHS